MSEVESSGLESVDGYERLTFLGRGGTATLYSARRSSDGLAVALKIFDPHQNLAAARQRRAAEHLDGVEGIVPTLDHGTLPDGRAFAVAPFISGGSLADHIARFGPMSPQQTATLGSALAEALHEAHRAGVVHRDLKPSNVLLGEGETPFLADFGASTSIEPTTNSETMAVTLLYAAPEVLEGAPADERADLYSLGLTLQAVATGANPYGELDLAGLAPLVDRICAVGPPDPGAAGIPDGLAAVIRRATALDPDDRYPDGAALAAALRRVATLPDAPPADSDPNARPAQQPEPATTSKSRRRRWVAAGAVAAAAVLLAAVIWFAQSEGDPERADAETATTTTAQSTLGPPVTEANGVLGALYQQDDFAYAGQLTRACDRSERWVALSIHAGQDDRKAGVVEPWTAVGGKDAGTFMAYLPCESGGRNIRYVLRAPGRWFTVVAAFPQDQYDRMVEWMRENETSPAPDYTVDDPIRATLADRSAYLGWSIIDRAQ